MRKFATAKEEGQFLIETVKELLERKQPEEICLVARTGKLLTDQLSADAQGGQGAMHHAGEEERPGEPGVRLGTMHRVKGLEFPVMLLAGVNKGVVPMRVSSVEGDPPPGRTRGARAILALCGGDPGEGSLDRHRLR